MKTMYALGVIAFLYWLVEPVIGTVYFVLWWVLFVILVMAEEEREIQQKQRHKPPPPKPKPKESKTIIMEYDEQTERFTQKKVTV